MIPVVFSVSGHDVFRLPQLLVLQACGILLAGLTTAISLIRGEGIAPRPWPRDLMLVLLAAIGWSSALTLTSFNVELSMLSLLTVLAAAMLFVATYNGAAGSSLALLFVAFVPMVANAVFALLQRTGTFNPFDYDRLGATRSATVGFLGNPNDLGTYLVYPTLAAAALAIVSAHHRWLGAALALLGAAGILASETLGSIAALIGSGLTMLWVVSRKKAIAAAGLGVVAAMLSLFLPAERIRDFRKDIVIATTTGDIDPLLSGRMPAILAAWHLFKQQPVKGHGLGSFPAHYFDARLAIEADHPEMMRRHPRNYSEVHNEYLQLLAEGGLPAALIFLAAFAVLASRSRGFASMTSVRARFARLYALPLAVALAITSVAQFPMRLAAPMATVLYLAGITFAWSDDAAG